MNYKELYNRFLSTRPTRIKKRGQHQNLELHHIIPRSIGGTDTPDNIIALTPKEHWIAHRILYRMTEGVAKQKMAYALIMMIGNSNGPNSEGYRPTARQYAWLKRINSQQSKKRWQDPAYRAKQMAWRNNLPPITEQAKAKMRETWRLKRSSLEEHRISLILKWAQRPDFNNLPKLVRRRHRAKLKQIERLPRAV